MADEPHSTAPSAASGRGERPRAARQRLRLLLALGAILALGVALGVGFALRGGSGGRTLPGGATQGSPAGGFFGTLALPARPAPPISLRNYLGQPVSLSRYRGEPVLVTFLYTHCPDVCPLIAADLGVVLRRLGARARRTQVIAVSVDPHGDTPASVASFLKAHLLVGRMQYLLGSPEALARTWRAWGVGSRREVAQPERVEHSALVYGIGASGRLLTVYPAGFAPAQIVHDVPRLAAS